MSGRVSASALARQELGSGKVSDYIRQAKGNLAVGDEVLLVARETPTHNAKDDRRRLSDQLLIVRQKANSMKLKIVGELAKRCWGYDSDWWAEIARAARLHGPNTKVLGERPTRFIRSEFFEPQLNPHALPTHIELQSMKCAFDGVQVFTLQHPDAHSRKDASFRAKRGQRLRDSRGGGDRKPGYKRRRRKELKCCAQDLYDTDSGRHCFSIREMIHPGFLWVQA